MRTGGSVIGGIRTTDEYNLLADGAGVAALWREHLKARASFSSGETLSFTMKNGIMRLSLRFR
jgi:hypothetical protein